MAVVAVEVHTELISVETRMMLILLELMRSEQAVSAFLKRTSDHIKYCVSSFRACLDMMKSRRSWESEASQRNFKSGLYLSIGVFNVVLALLPDKVQRVLQEHDCSGDKELGATYLTQAVEVDGVQQTLARLVVTAMDFLVEPPFLRPLADTCLQQLQHQHPKVRRVSQRKYFSTHRQTLHPLMQPQVCGNSELIFSHGNSCHNGATRKKDRKEDGTRER